MITGSGVVEGVNPLVEVSHGVEVSVGTGDGRLVPDGVMVIDSGVGVLVIGSPKVGLIETGGVGEFVLPGVSDNKLTNVSVEVGPGIIEGVNDGTGVAVLKTVPLGDEVEVGLELGKVVVGDAIVGDGVRLLVGDKEGVSVGVNSGVGEERSSLPGEGSSFSRQSPA